MLLHVCTHAACVHACHMYARMLHVCTHAACVRACCMYACMPHACLWPHLRVLRRARDDNYMHVCACTCGRTWLHAYALYMHTSSDGRGMTTSSSQNVSSVGHLHVRISPLCKCKQVSKTSLYSMPVRCLPVTYFLTYSYLQVCK